MFFPSREISDILEPSLHDNPHDPEQELMVRDRQIFLDILLAICYKVNIYGQASRK